MAEHDWRHRLAAVDDWIARASSARAQVIAAEAARRGRGGQRQIAQELGVSDNAISKSVARARAAADAHQRLPFDTFDRLLTAERADLPPLTEIQWQAVAFVVRGLIIDASWIEQPALLLAEEISEADEISGVDIAGILIACRCWSRVQALAVIDACQRGNLDTLPTAHAAPDSARTGG